MTLAVACTQVNFLWLAFPEPDGSSNNNGTIMVSITHQPPPAPRPRPREGVCVWVGFRVNVIEIVQQKMSNDDTKAPNAN